MRPALFLLAITLAQPNDAFAQLPTWLRPGARLRLTFVADHKPVIGTLVRFDRDSVRVLPDHRRSDVTISFSTVSRVDVSRERHTRAGAGMRTGFVLGAGFGVLGTVSNNDIGNKGLAALVFGGVFGLLGAGVGGLVGATISADEWEPIGVGFSFNL